jgi:hypothetical protein
VYRPARRRGKTWPNTANERNICCSTADHYRCGRGRSILWVTRYAFQIKATHSPLWGHRRYSSVVADIRKSTWNSRAWTYQEAVSSKRRLFFTDRLILYACNSQMHCEADESSTLLHASLPGMFPDTYSSQLSITPEIRSIRQITAYSQRKLTYDSDALNAIRSTLMPFQLERGLGHYFLSGVPMTLDSNSKSRIMRIGFDWYHTSCSRRRREFPSWSWLGWEGAVQWLDSPLWHMDSGKLYIWKDSDGRMIESCIASETCLSRSGHLSAEQIKLTGNAATVFVPNNLGHTYISLPCGNGRELLLSVYWDSTPPDATAKTPFICFTSDMFWAETFSSLILEVHGTSHHRVGITRVQYDQVSGDLLVWDKVGSTVVDMNDEEKSKLLHDIWGEISEERTILLE